MGSIFFYLINSLQCLSPDTMVNLHGSRRVYRHSSGIMPENSQLQDAGDLCFVPHVPDCHSDSGRIRAYVRCMTLCCEYGSLQGCYGGGKKCSLPALSLADVQNPAASKSIGDWGSFSGEAMISGDAVVSSCYFTVKWQNTAGSWLQHKAGHITVSVCCGKSLWCFFMSLLKMSVKRPLRTMTLHLFFLDARAAEFSVTLPGQ